MAEPVPTADQISIDDASREFMLGRATLYRLIKAGKLTAYRRETGRPRVFVSRKQLRSLTQLKPGP